MFLLNKTLTHLEMINNILFIGTNIRLEAPLINARLRKAYLTNPFFIAYAFGLSINYLTYPVLNLGNSIKSLFNLFEGKLRLIKYFIANDFYNIYYFNKHSLFLTSFVGMSLFSREDCMGLFMNLIQFYINRNLPLQYLHVINIKLGRISLAEIGLININSIANIKLIQQSTFFYLCGVDLEFFNLLIFDTTSFFVYQGFFSNQTNEYLINILLPVCIYTENITSYLNLEGRYRRTSIAVIPFSGILTD